MNGDDIDKLNDLNLGLREGAPQDRGQLFGGLRSVNMRDRNGIMFVDAVFLHDLDSPLKRAGIGSDFFFDVNPAHRALINLQDRLDL